MRNCFLRSYPAFVNYLHVYISLRLVDGASGQYRPVSQHVSTSSIRRALAKVAVAVHYLSQAEHSQRNRRMTHGIVAKRGPLKGSALN